MIHWKQAAKNALLPFLLSRGLLFVFIILAHTTSFDRIPAREERNFHPQLTLSWTAAKEAIRCSFSSADGGWYFQLAEGGYAPGPYTSEAPKNWTFFPLFPSLIRALNVLTGSSLVSGLIISNICFFAFLVCFQLLFAETFLAEKRETALWLCCFFPVSYFFTAPLTESLFLFLTIAAWLAIDRQRPILGTLLVACLTATRPTGMFLLPAFALHLWQQKSIPQMRKLLLLPCMPLGLFSFVLFLWKHTGEPLAFVKNQYAWNRGKQDLFSLLEKSWNEFPHVFAPWEFIWLNLAAALLGLLAALYFAFRREFTYSLFLFCPVFAALLTGTTMSLARFIGAYFPLYIFLILVTPSARAERALLAIFISLFAAMSVLYGLHVTAAMA